MVFAGVFIMNSSGGAAPLPPGTNLSGATLEEVMADMATYAENVSPDTGGTITVNGTSYGGYDYRIADSANLPTPNVLNSFTASDWFTNTTNPNERVALVVFKGNLTMSSITFEPSNSTNNAKSFTVIYVDGNLTLSSSTVSMTRRGGENPSYTSLPLTAAPHTTRTLTGTAGTGGNGGRSAYTRTSPVQTSWNGKAGGLFSGGGGGSGGLNTGTNTITITGQSNAEPRGGQGGGSVTTFNGWNIGGGGGNLPGTGVKQNGSGYANNGQQGTGGTIIIIVNGTFTGTGSNVNAQGASGGSAQQSGGQAAAGGGSGGGRVRVLAKTLASTASTSVTGGSGGGGGTANGNAGNAGDVSQTTY